MKERPILFSGPMVRAVLEGRKTQTRRVIAPQPPSKAHFTMGRLMSFAQNGSEDHRWKEIGCPYGQPGDRLWVRETFFIDHFGFYPSGRLPSTRPSDVGNEAFIYAADGSCCQQLGECACDGFGACWRPSIHMPRWASRINLEIESVRVERVQDIGNEDAFAEGVELKNGWNLGAIHPVKGHRKVFTSPRDAFKSLWNSINEGRGYDWGVNPWVWVIEFRRIES